MAGLWGNVFFFQNWIKNDQNLENAGHLRIG